MSCRGAWLVGDAMIPSGRPDSAESGIALIVTMMAALLLVALAGMLAPLATIETAVGANHRRSVQALYAAEAALELATAELGSFADWNGALDGSVRSAFRNGALAPAMPDGSRVDLPAITAPASLRRRRWPRARMAAVRARPAECLGTGARRLRALAGGGLDCR